MSTSTSLVTFASLQNDTSATTDLNTNFSAINTALTNSLALNGQAPNQMQANLDMNSNQILNLPAPTSNFSPIRLADASTLGSGGTITINPLPGAGTTGQVLTKNSNTSFDVSWLNIPADPITVTASKTPAITNSLTFSGTDGTTLTFQGTDTYVGRATTDTLTNKTLTSPTINTPTITAPVISTITNAGTITLPNATSTLLSTAGQIGSFSTSNPSGTTSTVGVMMGLGSTFTFTPKFSTRALVCLNLSMANSTASDGATATLRFGTGSAPANAAANTGTASNVACSILNNANTAATSFSASVVGIITGLTINTAYWLDVSLAAITGGTASITNPVITVTEI